MGAIERGNFRHEALRDTKMSAFEGKNVAEFQ